jgi:hypothetical protein
MTNRQADRRATRSRASEDDPIFRAIDRHRVTVATINDPKKHHRNVSERENARYGEALASLVGTMPTSPAGLLALLRYVREKEIAALEGRDVATKGIEGFLKMVEDSATFLFASTDTLAPIGTRASFFDIVCSMEDNTTAVRDYANAIALLCETEAMEDHMALSFQRLAWDIKHHVQTLEERRGKLFHIAHPSRRQFA